jgi:predicted anti-sigma-YlaC factor YlaD
MSGLERPGPCIAARERIHEMLDGPVPSGRDAELERHLAECEACTAFRNELALVGTALRELPEVAMPDDALDDVWDRTVFADETGGRFMPRARSVAADTREGPNPR